jgi:hypothetical protein
MGNSQTRDYKKEFVYRLWASDLRDKAFIEQFYQGEEVEHHLKSAERHGEYEEELGWFVNRAWEHYERYWLDSLNRRQERGTQEGNIPPKKKRRARKPKDIAGVWERQETLARYLEEVALKDAEIIRFRERAMSGRLLSEEEALAILSSPILADQPLSMLTSNGISLLENSHLLEEEADAKGPYRKLVIKGWRPWKVRPLAAKGPELVYPADFIRFQNLLGLRAARAITFHHPREEDQVVIAREGSFIAQLVRLAEDRLRGYPISTEMGVWFILTGEFISQDPVRLRYVRYRHPEFSRTTFTLEVEGWVPPEEVLEQYRHAQHEVLGGTPRSLKRRTVALFGFVNRYKGKSWRELFDAWNKAHRDQRFRDRSHLFTTYMRALEYIVGVKPTKVEDGKQLEVAGSDPYGWPIIANKWYLLHPDGYTGSFDSREEAEADPRSEDSEVLAAEQLVARLAERTNNN